ncbi:MAG: hypothetical protein ACO3AY_07475 [Chitinophagaceae bacterium]
MKRNHFLWVFLMLLIVACNKDKFTTEPQVEVKSIQPSTVINGAILQLLADYTDNEGDLDSALVVYKWYNGNNPSFIDTLIRFPFSRLNLPTNLRKAEMVVQFEYNTLNQINMLTLPGVTRDTSATLGLILIDKTGKRSNYSESNKIRLRKP